MKFVKTLFISMLLAFSTNAMAKSAYEIESDSDKALATFYNEIDGTEKFLKNSKAYVVFPDINEGGMFIGGKYGEGVLRIGNTSKAYYSITSASIGMQMGVKNYSMIIVFTSDAALNKFLLDDDEWETDIDGQIAIAEWNSKEELDDIDLDDSMTAFVFDSMGMMGSFTLEGTKFERINPDD